MAPAATAKCCRRNGAMNALSHANSDTAVLTMASNTGGTIGGRLLMTLQDFGGRGLPLQRLLRLVEQAHIFHRDRSLVGKRRDEIDFLLVEWRFTQVRPSVSTPIALAFAHDRDREQCAVTPDLLDILAPVRARSARPRPASACPPVDGPRRQRILLGSATAGGRQVFDQGRRGAEQPGGTANVSFDFEDRRRATRDTAARPC